MGKKWVFDLHVTIISYVTVTLLSPLISASVDTFYITHISVDRVSVHQVSSLPSCLPVV